MKEVALALGGGGARGLAHLKYLEFFEESDVSITRISGSSIGAIMGALFASGKSAKTIREELQQYFIFKGDRKRDVVKKVPDLMSWLTMINLDVREAGIMKADAFLENFMEELETMSFEDLEIPLTVIATDFWSGEQVVINSGPLKPAIMASAAIPGVFPPVEHMDRVLVDGSLSTSVPYFCHCDGDDLNVGIDLSPDRVPKKGKVPKAREATEGMFDIFIDHMVKLQLKESKPDVYFRPGIENVGILEFDKVESIYDQAEKSVSKLKALCREQGLEI